MLNPNFDISLAEFMAFIRMAFATRESSEIEFLKSKISEREKAHQPTALLRRELCELMAAQIRREIAA